MPRRIALCVAVSSYQTLAPLANATRDAQAMAHVLRQVAGFDDVCVLLDPDLQQFGEASENLFADKEVDDVVLLFFSGHGVKDERGHLYLAVPGTRKRANGELIRATAVACRDIHETMSASRSRRQVVILDCCFSGAFADGIQPKDGGKVDLRAQFGGEGRAVLTSSASTQFSFDTSEAGLSTYTHFIVGGIASGEADLNHDGLVTVEELHEFARSRVQNVRPGMCPQILPTREGYSIVISAAGKADPRLAYAAKVREVADANGSISQVAAQVLALRREQLGLTAEDAHTVEETELKPRRARVKARAILRKAVYEARSRKGTQSGRPLLNELRITLELTDGELADLLSEPISSQRKMVLGWRYWPSRALIAIAFLAALVGISAIAWNMRDYDTSGLIYRPEESSSPGGIPVPVHVGGTGTDLLVPSGGLAEMNLPHVDVPKVKSPVERSDVGAFGDGFEMGEGETRPVQEFPQVKSPAKSSGGEAGTSSGYRDLPTVKSADVEGNQQTWSSSVKAALNKIKLEYKGPSKALATYRFQLVVCSDGSVERIKVTKPSGDARLDGAIKAALEAVILPVPPAEIRAQLDGKCKRIPYDFTWSGRDGKGFIK